MEFEITDYFKTYFDELSKLLKKVSKFFTDVTDGSRFTAQQKKTFFIICGIVLAAVIVVCTIHSFMSTIRESHNSPYDTDVRHTKLGVPGFMKGGGAKLWKFALVIFLLGTGVCEWFFMKGRYTLSLHNLLGLSVLFAVVRVAAGFALMLLAGILLYAAIGVLINIPADIISLVLFLVRGIFTGKGFDKRLYESCNSKIFNMLSLLSGALSILCAVAVYAAVNIAPLVILAKNSK